MTVVVTEAFKREWDIICIIQNKILTNGLNSKYQIRVSTQDSVEKLCSEVSRKTNFVLDTFDLALILENDMRQKLNQNSKEALGQALDINPSKKKVYFEILPRENVQVQHTSPNISTIREDETEEFQPTSSQSGGKPGVTFKRRAAISSETIDIQTKFDIEKMNDQNLLNNELPSSSPPPLLTTEDTASLPPSVPKYRGLVNQAMTCYLNSLIQSLFMTPEFRNTLYRWKFDPEKDNKEGSLPYQLQNLFLQLQTSDEKSVETFGLTRSFGWSDDAAYNQHDVQELCRVMFDVLEKKFKDTDQADMLRLYEGHMKDYVRCCECSYESAKDDKFQDLAITMRPFGSQTSYKSVMEGLNAYVEPELLNGPNQYNCERCNKKCDAKKGFKFTKFPYLLTLQLKRFTFDFDLQRRVKLQDRMDFPMYLDLNSFIESDDRDDGNESTSDKESSCPSSSSKEAADYRLSPGPCDEEDLSSHDSGQDYDRASAIITSSIPPTSSAAGEYVQPSASGVVGLSRSALAASSGMSETGGEQMAADEEDLSSVDEGIDVGASSTTSTVKSLQSNATSCQPSSASATLSSTNLIKQQQAQSSWNNDNLQDKPLMYELFSIMVHSGTAIGGHYYAYIKSFEDGLWYWFNDQSVTQVAPADIEKTFGGGSSYTRSYSYSSFSNSSSNAYMLMYRQMDKERNADFMQPEDFPPHIKQLIELEKTEREERRKQLEYEKNMNTIKLFCKHPSAQGCANQGIDFKFHKDTKLEDAVRLAFDSLKLDENIIPIRNCRLVTYDHIKEAMDRSFDVTDDEDRDQTLLNLLGVMKPPFIASLLMETKNDDQIFKKYLANGITARVHVAHPENLVLFQYFSDRFEEHETVLTLKISIAKRIHRSPCELIVIYERFGRGWNLLNRSDDEKTLKTVGMYRCVRIYVDVISDDDKRLHASPCHEFKLEDTRLFTILDRMQNSIRIKVSLPPTNESNNNTLFESLIEPPSYNYMIDSNLPQLPTAEAATTTTMDTSEQGGASWDDHIPEATEDQQYTSYMEVASSFRRRRTNSCCEENPPFNFEESADFASAVLRKLQGAVHKNNDDEEDDGEDNSSLCMNVSPTSSLRCEADGGSIHTPPGSLILDEVDFDEAAIPSTQHESTDDVQQHDAMTSSNVEMHSSDDDEGFQIKSKLASFPHPPSTLESCDHLTLQSDVCHVVDDVVTPMSSHHQNEMRLTQGDEHEASDSYNKALQYADMSAEEEPAEKPAAAADWQSGKNINMTELVEIESRKLQANVSSTSGAGDAAGCHKNPPNYQQRCDVPRRSWDSSPSPPSSPSCKKQASSQLSYERKQQASSSPHKTQEGATDRRDRSVSQSSCDGYDVPKFVFEKNYHFSLVQTQQRKNEESNTVQQVLDLELDKRMPMIVLRKNIAQLIEKSNRNICLYKVNLSKQEVELTNPNEDFSLACEHQEFTVKYERPLRKNECRCKVFLMDLNTSAPMLFLFPYVLTKGKNALEVKKEICHKLAQIEKANITPERLRLRKKNWSAPAQIYLPDDVVIKQVNSYANLELCIQLLPGPEPKLSKNHHVVLCRRWRPSQLSYDECVEVVIELDKQRYHGQTSPYALVRQEISAKLDCNELPAERIAIAKMSMARLDNFPPQINPLGVDRDLDWNYPNSSNCLSRLEVSLDDTCIFIFKDVNEKMKEISEKERSDLMGSEVGIDSLTSEGSATEAASSSFNRPIGSSYRRTEKALKIAYTVDNNDQASKNKTTRFAHNSSPRR